MTGTIKIVPRKPTLIEDPIIKVQEMEMEDSSDFTPANEIKLSRT